MQNQSPKYRISYNFCKEKGHQSQRTNLVCLNKDCIQKSLICSFCVEENHKHHQTKPLKHFLQNLQKQYSKELQNNNTAENQLEQLENQKYYLLNKLKSAVQNIAQNFLNLEQQIIEKYQLIKTQILEREARKKRFTQFYKIMTNQGKGDPNFQIQNYLNFEPLYVFNITSDLENFVNDSNKTFKDIKAHMIVRKKDHLPVQINEKMKEIVSTDLDQFILPKSIKQKDNIFSSVGLNTKQIGYLNVNLNKFTGKIRLRIIQLPQTSLLTIGVAKLQDINQSNQLFPLKNNTGAWLNSKGQTQGLNYNYINSMKNQSILEVTVKKNHCKINEKKNICDLIISNKEQCVFFFCIEGFCQIQIIYPYNKN